MLKNTGIIKLVDELGRIVIPIEIRKNLKIKEKDKMNIYLENDNIVIEKYIENEENNTLTRRVDELGRVVIPIEIRYRLEIKEKDKFEIYVDNNKIILKMYKLKCIFCESEENLIEHKNKLICNKCTIKIIKKIIEKRKGTDHFF